VLNTSVTTTQFVLESAQLVNCSHNLYLELSHYCLVLTKLTTLYLFNLIYYKISIIVIHKCAPHHNYVCNNWKWSWRAGATATLSPYADINDGQITITTGSAPVANDVVCIYLFSVAYSAPQLLCCHQVMRLLLVYIAICKCMSLLTRLVFILL